MVNGECLNVQCIHMSIIIHCILRAFANRYADIWDKGYSASFTIIMRHHQHNTNSYTNANENCNSPGCHNSFQQSNFVSQSCNDSNKSIAKHSFRLNLFLKHEYNSKANMYCCLFVLNRIRITLANILEIGQTTLLIWAYAEYRKYCIFFTYLFRIYRRMTDRKRTDKRNRAHVSGA